MIAAILIVSLIAQLVAVTVAGRYRREARNPAQKWRGGDRTWRDLLPLTVLDLWDKSLYTESGVRLLPWWCAAQVVSSAGVVFAVILWWKSR